MRCLVTLREGSEGMVKLLFEALAKFLVGLLLLVFLLFLPAGTIFYPHAWLFMVLLFLPMLCLGLILFIKAPGLLQKRLQNKEKQKAFQRERGCDQLTALRKILQLAGCDQLCQQIARRCGFHWPWYRLRATPLLPEMKKQYARHKAAF